MTWNRLVKVPFRPSFRTCDGINLPYLEDSPCWVLTLKMDYARYCRVSQKLCYDSSASAQSNLTFLRTVSQCFLEEHLSGKYWFSNFMQRNPLLSVRTREGQIWTQVVGDFNDLLRTGFRARIHTHQNAFFMKSDPGMRFAPAWNKAVSFGNATEEFLC